MLLVSWRGSRVCSRLHKGTAFRPPRMRGREGLFRRRNISTRRKNTHSHKPNALVFLLGVCYT